MRDSEASNSTNSYHDGSKTDGKSTTKNDDNSMDGSKTDAETGERIFSTDLVQ